MASPTTAPAELLAAAVEARAQRTAAEAREFALAARWAEAHPAPVEDAVVNAYGELRLHGHQPVTLAGEGAPGMSEFAVAEYAAAVCLSTFQARALIGAALEAKYRLPKIWSRAMAGEVAVWKVRRVTEHTHRLDPIAAAYVDRHLAPVLATCTWAQVERAVATAAAADPDHVEDTRVDRTLQQHLDVALAEAAANGGLVAVHGLLDYADALALEEQIKAGAHALLKDHPELTLDMRRAMAAGHLGGSTSREVVIYAHHTPAEAHGIVGIERLGHTTIEQLETWCTDNNTTVSIRPILDLDDEIEVPGYTPSTRQREQAILTTPTCVFPHCGKSSRSCDLDHVVPYAQGGRTTSSNLAPLCRFHHRAKTHSHWTYRRLSRTRLEWTSPLGTKHTVDFNDHRRRRTR